VEVAAALVDQCRLSEPTQNRSYTSVQQLPESGRSFRQDAETGTRPVAVRRHFSSVATKADTT
jgi:hypothetical protein